MLVWVEQSVGRVREDGLILRIFFGLADAGERTVFHIAKLIAELGEELFARLASRRFDHDGNLLICLNFKLTL